ncbi:MAG: hypothetical protein P1U74_08790 [Legionellaceae bacterium]|nr:hypothetical protein [Legionellaceae bacterium]
MHSSNRDDKVSTRNLRQISGSSSDKRVYSSSSETFISRLKNYATHPEFKSQVPYKYSPEFKVKTSLVALALMDLWIPKKSGEDDNYIPKYFFDRQSQKIALIHTDRTYYTCTFYNSPWPAMNASFREGNIQNIGAISYLNLIMGGTFNSERLGVVVRDELQPVFFTQKSGVFWHNYCKTTEVIEESPQTRLFEFVSSVRYKGWWDKVQQGMTKSLHLLFLQEIFPVAFRISLTPNSLIVRIIKSYLGDIKEADDFSKYVISIKESAIQDLTASLPEDDLRLWKVFCDEQALDSYAEYQEDIKKYLAYRCYYYPSYEVLDLFVEMFMHADKFGIPQFIESRVEEFRQLGSVHDRTHVLINLFDRIGDNWKFLSSFHDNTVWLFLDKITEGLYEEIVANRQALCVESNEFIFALLLDAIRFALNNLAKFLILEFPDLSKMVLGHNFYTTYYNRQFINYSALRYAEAFDRTEIVDLLKCIESTKVEEPVGRSRSNAISLTFGSIFTADGSPNPNTPYPTQSSNSREAVYGGLRKSTSVGNYMNFHKASLIKEPPIHSDSKPSGDSLDNEASNNDSVEDVKVIRRQRRKSFHYTQDEADRIADLPAALNNL